MLKGILKVVKYDDRFEFTNPGLLKLPIEQIYAGEESDARNQSIQAFFRMIGYGEGIGSGFPLILSAWEEKHWKHPELIEQQELMQVKLVMWIVEDENVANDVTANVTEQLSEKQIDTNKNVTVSNSGDVTVNGNRNVEDILKTLNARQKAIVRIIIAQPKVTVDELSEHIIVNRRTILRDIKVLQQKDILWREGSDKTGRWVVKLKFME